jgi:hypothetical protein
MDYQNDIVLPTLIEKIKVKTAHLKKLTHEEEGKLLSLTNQQKEIITKADKVLKEEYITSPPVVHSPSLKSHNKYKSFTDLLHTMK